MTERLLGLRGALAGRAPLVHCLQGPISMTDTANLLLACGARPIMAEHPDESAAITAGADALLLNLGGITESRMLAMERSAQAALEGGIPTVLDLVGVGCSPLRLDFARSLVERFRPAVVKGNFAEITALAENRLTVKGVDADGGHLEQSPEHQAMQALSLAERWDCTVLASGPVDVAAGDAQVVLLRVGHPMLSRITGTGCMLGALTAALCSVGAPLEAAAAAALLEGCAGEIAAGRARGPGTFRQELLDALYTATDDQIRALARVERIPTYEA